MKLVQRWVFTANNPPEDWEEKAKSNDAISYAFVGREVAPSTGTPHLQGYLELKARKRLPGMKKVMKSCGLEGAHLEQARGKLEQIQAYNGKTDKEPVTWGVPMVGQGTRTDIEMILKEAEEGASFMELARKFPGTHSRVYKWADRISSESETERELKKAKTALSEAVLRPWQEKVWAAVQAQNDRQVTWVWEAKGNQGKSWMARWIRAIHGAFITTGGKYADVIFAYRKEDIVVFDMCRDYSDKMPYSLIENFKNGTASSGKYESKTKEKWGGSKVVVFANFPPERGRLSDDRLDVHHICTL